MGEIVFGWCPCEGPELPEGDAAIPVPVKAARAASCRDAENAGNKAIRMKTSITSIATIGFLALSSTLVIAGQNLETKIGIFDFSGPTMPESELVERLGTGFIDEYKVGNKVFSKSRIYFLKDENLWIKVDLSHVFDENGECRVEAVTVTKNKLCDESYEPIHEISPMITSRGIRIGDGLRDVVDQYGEPGRRIEVSKGGPFSLLKEDLDLDRGLAFRYFTENSQSLHQMEFYFQDDKLHSFIISISE